MIQTLLVFINTYKIHMIVAIAIILFLVLSSSKKLEKLTMAKPSIFENVIVSPKCKEITPIKLFQLFNNDLNKMTETMIANSITTDELANPNNYPKIASYLMQNKVISC